MKANFKNAAVNASKAIYRRVQKGVSTRDALGISLVLHLLLGVAFATWFVGQTVVAHRPEESKLVFELASQPEISVDKIVNSSAFANNQNAGNPAEAADGRASSATNEAAMSKEQIMMASLSSLSQLKDTFNFVFQQTSADSVGEFSPAHGDAPDVESLAAGLRDGNGLGRGNGSIIISGGGGHCPAPGVLQ
ncbi:hypothetical protein D6833_04885 [Candidatus Parcubacteria bacterium]|nr:MAG: hypothetical protein D6833_04885 [Candidatus Parcubacteria bacterium]